MAVEQQDVRTHDLYLKYPQSISGTVRDADTNQPIASAEIYFSSNEGGLASGEESDPRALSVGPEQKSHRCARPLSALCPPPRGHRAAAGTPDRYNRDDVHGWRTVIAEPQQETTVDFCCDSGAPLTGRVVNPDGTPAKDARVRVSVSWPVRVMRNRSRFWRRHGPARGPGGR